MRGKQDCERRIARQPEQKQQLVVRTSPSEPRARGDVAHLGHDPRSSAAADGPCRRRAGHDNARQRHKVMMHACVRSVDERGGEGGRECLCLIGRRCVCVDYSSRPQQHSRIYLPLLNRAHVGWCMNDIAHTLLVLENNRSCPPMLAYMTCTTTSYKSVFEALLCCSTPRTPRREREVDGWVDGWVDVTAMPSC